MKICRSLMKFDFFFTKFNNFIFITLFERFVLYTSMRFLLLRKLLIKEKIVFTKKINENKLENKKNIYKKKCYIQLFIKRLFF